MTSPRLGGPVPHGVSVSDAFVGHEHLSVGDTAKARESYVDRLGFDASAEVGNQALFVASHQRRRVLIRALMQDYTRSTRYA